MIQFVWSVLPVISGTGMNIIMDSINEHNLVDHSWKVLNIPHYIDQYHRESELSVKFNDCARAISDIIKVKVEYNIPMSHIIEVR